MGLDVNGIKFLMLAKENGVNFEKMAIIGRQELHIDFHSLKNIFELFNINKTNTEINSLLFEENHYAEPLLKTIGAKNIYSIDVSSYEGASLIHDMNNPIPDKLKNAFTAVLDSGSLEHVFNFPVAIKNCMEMTSVGGHFLGITIANNFMGHGFYQFSPELYFCIFNKENGFYIEKAIIFESIPNTQWYEVTDPKNISKRIELVNCIPTYLLIQAKKRENVNIFKFMPKQHYYVIEWDRNNNSQKNNVVIRGELLNKIKLEIKQFVPKFLAKIYRITRAAIKASSKMRFNPEYFKKIN